MRRAAVLGILAALVCAAPAAAADPEIEDGSAQVALDAAEAWWGQKGFGGDYDWWPGGYLVRVRDGVPVDPAYGAEPYATVPLLFARVQQAIDDRVDDFAVTYDLRGAPNFVRLDNLSVYVGAVRAGDYIENVLAELEASRLRWARQRLSDYDLNVALACFCPPQTTAPVDVHVRGGEPVAPPQHVAAFASIERLFTYIENSARGTPYQLEVTYSGDGRPERIYWNPVPGVADGQFAITTSDLRPATYDPVAQAALDAAKAQWEREKLADYGYRIRILRCLCPRAYTRDYAVHVREGRPVHSHRYIRGRDTVEKLFALVQGAIDTGAARLEVTYGPRGVPRLIEVDRSFYVADDESAIAISAVKAEPAGPPKKIALAILDGTARRELRAAQRLWREAGRPRRRTARERFGRIATAIDERASVLRVRYSERGVPVRVVTRP